MRCTEAATIDALLAEAAYWQQRAAAADGAEEREHAAMQARLRKDSAAARVRSTRTDWHQEDCTYHAAHAQQKEA